MNWKEHLAGRLVIASVSGGKDSAAMSLWLTENGIEHRRVFADTGWEHPSTYEYLRGPLTEKLGKIDEVRWTPPDGLPEGMAGLVLKKGMFPSRTRRFCTENLKVIPILKYVSAIQDAGHDPVNSIGIRAAESEARSKLPEWEWNERMDLEVWRPLIRWTEAEVIEMHRRHGLAPNPLYLLGASRVGCWPCIFAKKKEIVFIADKDPTRIDTIRQLEVDVAKNAKARYDAVGESFETLGYNEPTFFQASGRLRSEGKDGRMVPIDEVVRWARTSHGGRQFELFTPETEEGCVRWGLCETGEDE